MLSAVHNPYLRSPSFWLTCLHPLPLSASRPQASRAGQVCSHLCHCNSNALLLPCTSPAPRYSQGSFPHLQIANVTSSGRPSLTCFNGLPFPRDYHLSVLSPPLRLPPCKDHITVSSRPKWGGGPAAGTNWPARSPVGAPSAQRVLSKSLNADVCKRRLRPRLSPSRLVHVTAAAGSVKFCLCHGIHLLCQVWSNLSPTVIPSHPLHFSVLFS